MTSDDNVTHKEIEECLSRSGYLMESRLVRSLVEEGYFVEPNQSVRDPRTGKSREIDLVVEYFKWNPAHDKVAVGTAFFLEALNNKYPFVLLTERPYTPASDFESYIKFVSTPEPSPFLGSLDLYEEKEADWNNLFSQYCAITRKSGKAELMASHPDDVYASLLKLSEYVENAISISFEGHEAYWRLFFWQPMIVVSGQLVIATVDTHGAVQIKETDLGRLEFSWHDAEEPRTTVVEVVTEAHLLSRLATIRAKDEELAAKIHAVKLKCAK
jgi:hypothetical protein